MNTRFDLRQKRKARVRAKVTGTAARPRMSVFRSNQGLLVQLIDDTKGVTMAAATVKGKNKAAGKTLGAAIAELAKKRGIKIAVFDRSGYRFHGAVKEIADAAREGGLKI
ncbi:MAG: 50S ribosomal protein L18 [Candidatus Gottesmanbacteria bacterium GW2011_GWB1_49_7]|uniref:Large ribosomal subunit protein uL18 n=1 Tax=Candidatus Gottesmanbacteria bacterium GW2011_GWB1_49_7 TaxID=1618448 RepID=A0A0G1VY79_9BACT|nr:MAG: 50S ribosomal protein L18 [Microgenomates group bacterium GW2011_GWC1_49_7]KKW11421.1 MAG: 50S ribosomal protein L18 [Candidatus Gottesmanbacteria bacterium GW2011_GWB1_49_7]